MTIELIQGLLRARLLQTPGLTRGAINEVEQ